jgi:ribonuclease P protein component
MAAASSWRTGSACPGGVSGLDGGIATRAARRGRATLAFDSPRPGTYIASDIAPTHRIKVTRREADVSAEPTRTQAPPRLSLAHVHRRRSQGDRGAPGTRAQAPLGLSHDDDAAAPAAATAVVVRLRRRGEFVAAARGAKQGAQAFLLQAVRRRGRPDGKSVAAAGEVGIGITVTRKIGGAVVRNRARRRLREALRQLLPGPAKPGHDYVVVARPAALRQPFAELAADLGGAFKGIERRLAWGRP